MIIDNLMNIFKHGFSTLVATDNLEYLSKLYLYLD